MFVFLFVVSCIVFISTISWLSYKLAETRSKNPSVYAVIGFLLSFLPPVALIFIAALAFKDESKQIKFQG